MILSQHVYSYYASELLASERQGVGYLLKDRVVDVEEFVAALERIRGGGTVVDRSLVDAAGFAAGEAPPGTAHST